MFLSKFPITNDILCNEVILDKVIQDWEKKYLHRLDFLCSQYNIDNAKSITSNDSDSESNDTTSKLIREAIKCKAYIDVEYKAIQDIRSELEDCQMVKELGESLQQLSEEKEHQNKEMEKLSNKNWHLQQEKERLEKSLRDIRSNSSLSNEDQNNRKTILAERLENLRNRAQNIKNMNENSYYCHIAPTINILSDSEHSISEEDSLEKDKRKDPTVDTERIFSPVGFNSGISRASKSTPIKDAIPNGNTHSKSVPITSKTEHTEINGNLTQDLKDIRTYLNGEQEDAYINHVSIIDWDMSQLSIDDSKEKIVNGDILQGKEDPDDGPSQLCAENSSNDANLAQIASLLTANVVCSSKNFINQLDIDTNDLKLELQLEKDKYNSLSDHIAKLYDALNGANKHLNKHNPKCSGDQPDEEAASVDPIKQICYIEEILHDKKESPSDKIENVDIDQYTKQDQIDEDKDSLTIFKSLSEASVRLLTEIVNNLFNIRVILSEKKDETIMTDNTSLVMDYLQYLISLKHIDFSNDDARRHPIYELVKDLEKNVQSLLYKVLSKEKEKSGLSKELESYYQEQLNKCYDDISRLKRQLESSQQLLSSKMPIDTTEALFEAKQKLQEELKSVDREYSRQMTRERKRLEESEAQYNELLAEYENMQKKYNAEVTGFQLSIDHLQRQHENDLKFIDQQHFEWELERSQHTADIDNLNKTIGRIKQSSSCSDNLSECGESPVKGQLKKSNSLPKSSRNPLLPDNEVTFLDNSSQTVYQSIIVLNKQLTRRDLENCDEFRSILLNVKENDKILLSIVHELSDVIFDVVEKEGLVIHLPNLLELSEKDIENLLPHNVTFWDDVKSEIWKFKDFVINFLREGRLVTLDYDRLQEELESSLTNLTLKQGQIHALEEEVQSLTEFQTNLSKDYDLLQVMLEEKQAALDDISNNALFSDSFEKHEEVIIQLKRELIEKQNIIDERDEDLYVLKEEKENYEHERSMIQRQHDINLENHKDMYQDLELELKESLKINNELHQQISDLIIKHDAFAKEINEKENSESFSRTTVLDLTRDNEFLQQKLISVTDENNLSQLRLKELEQQHRHNLDKLNKNLEETERMNLELLQCKVPKNVATACCQTDQVPNNVPGVVSHTSCVNIQEKLISTIELLKNEYSSEKDKRGQIELKHRQFVAQYDALSNKIYSLETSAKDPKFLISGDNANESFESFDRNTFLNASQVSLQSIEDDIELLASLRSNNDLGQFRSVGCQTVIKNDTTNSIMDSNCGMNISDWLADLLNEVENVLQTCVIGDDISAEVLAKVSKFRQLLEQMYKKQLSVLLDKISNLERDLQTERKSNVELNNKGNFLMTEVQESESVQRNLKGRLDQVLSENNRLTENNRNLSDKSRSIKNELVEQINKLRDELESERFLLNDTTRQLKNEQRRREQLDCALSVANERTQLVEQSNSEIIKKSRQQMDYQQKEMDTLNAEYADMFRRCNEYKLQLESIQQSLRAQTLETEKAKNELRETIQSNTEYRTKMNNFIKIYQGKRSKLEVEAKELQQLLQISCRREITFIKENENLRMKCQTCQSVNKENERKIKELENCISDLHQRHEDDRHEWLKMINGSIDKQKDDSVLSQVNWLLRMLQLRIELLGLHYSPNTNFGSVCNGNSRFDCLPNGGNAELVMLLQSIKSMQSMISVYLSNNHDMSTLSCGHYSDIKTQYSSRSDKQHSSLSKRPKPTGSSDSLDSLSETESSSIPQDRIDTTNNVESINTKIYVLQMNKIVDLQLTVNRHERWRQSLLNQKKYILSQITGNQRATIEKPLLSEEQKISISDNFFKFKFKAIATVVIAMRRFSLTNKQIRSDSNTINYPIQATSGVPFPIFSTDHIDKKSEVFSTNKSVHCSSKPPTQLYSTISMSHNVNYSVKPEIRNIKYVDESVSGSSRSLHGNDHKINRQDAISNPIHCISPILEKPTRFAESLFTKSDNSKTYSSVAKHGLSNSYSNNPLRSSMKFTPTQNSLVSSLDRNILGKTVKLSNTIRQIDDFGKRLDKYTGRPTLP